MNKYNNVCDTIVLPQYMYMSFVLFFYDVFVVGIGYFFVLWYRFDIVVWYSIWRGILFFFGKNSFLMAGV